MEDNEIRFSDLEKLLNKFQNTDNEKEEKTKDEIFDLFLDQLNISKT